MSFHLLTFADSKFKPSLDRLRSQAVDLNVFNEIHICDENYISELIKKYSLKFFHENPGFGFWIWKPYLIRKTLKNLKEEDVLIYMDAGCEINPKAKRKFNFFIKKLNKSKGIIAPQLMFNYQAEKLSTKKDVLEFLGVSDNDKILNSPQIEANLIFIKKNKFSISLIEQWYNYSLNIQLLNFESNWDDVNRNNHKSDQSLFSIICKLNNIMTIPYYEFYLNLYTKINFEFLDGKVKARNDEFKLILINRNLRKKTLLYIKNREFYIILRNLTLDIFNIFHNFFYGYSKPRFRS